MISITQDKDTQANRIKDLQNRLKYKNISKGLYNKALRFLQKGYSIQYFVINDVVKEIRVIHL